VTQNKFEFDTVIVGAGAAGLMCAIEAGKRGRKVAIIELAGAIGKKILISGGGRCNFTNIYCSPANYISKNPHFCKSALARYTPFDFIELVQKHNIAFHEKTLGQQFCDNSSRQIVDMLKKECDENNVQIFLNTQITQVTKDNKFTITTNNSVFESQTLVIASGGLSIPKMGSTDFAHKIAKQFGLSVINCKPGLVPLTVSAKDLSRFSDLSGISMMCQTSCNDQSFKESFLFTHRGVSGPAVLQISSYWDPSNNISFNLLPDVDILNELMSAKKRGERSELKTILSNFIPKKFCEVLSQELGNSKPINEYSDKDLKHISSTLTNWLITPSGTEGYPKAEVTIGGVDTDELSSKTMESKKVSGLYFIGEGVDVTGHLGGFNFQWAWASGHAAGQSC
jgi:predicted Rossmann fold flavoprotein